MAVENLNRPNSQSSDKRDPFVPSARLESYFLSLTRQIECWREGVDSSTAIGVTGVRSGVGTSTVAYNLASCISVSRNKDVCVVECNFGKPFVSRRISDQLKGLSDVFAQTITTQQGLNLAGPVRLSLMGPGTLNAKEANRLVIHNFSKVVTELRENYDWIVFDLPIASKLTSCFDMASHLDGVTLVVGEKQGLDKATLAATANFKRLGIELIGLVRNSS